MDKVDLRENEYLEKFVGQEHVDSNDVRFWFHLLSRSFNFMRVHDPKMVDKTLDPYLVRLTLNNSQSFNIGSLIRVFLDRVSRIRHATNPSSQTTNRYYVFQAFNALYLLRTITKSYIENLSEEQLIKAFRARLDPIVNDTNKNNNQQPLQQQNLGLQQLQQLSHPPPTATQPPPQPQPLTVQSSSPQVTPTAYPTIQHSHALFEPTSTASIPEMPKVISFVNDSSPETTNNIQTNPVNSTQPTTSQSPISEQQSQPVTKSEITPGSVMLDHYISTLIAIIVDVPVDDSTYLLIFESINALLVLLSIQMYSNSSANKLAIYKCFMQKKCSIHALILTKTLLNNFVNQQAPPNESGSIIIGLASGLWKVLTLGYGQQTADLEEGSMQPLARQSLLLLNILTNHCTTSDSKNPYREAITHCQDSRFNLSDVSQSFTDANNDAMVTATTSKSVLMSNNIKMDFQTLYDTICLHLDDDQVALLLYMLLQSNQIFRPYILTTEANELDKLLLPLLKILYSNIDKGSHHVYMVLIIFIILSEEATFNEAVQKITLRNITWYKDRILTDISLANFTTLIIIRSFQYNTFRIKDKFLHTNLFATLANISNHFDHLHPYVCQRFLEFLERLGKRYALSTRHKDMDSQLNNKNAPNPHIQQLQSDTSSLNTIHNYDALARALATDSSSFYEQQDASSLELDSTSNINNNTNDNMINLFQQASFTNGNNDIISNPVPDPNGGAVNITMPHVTSSHVATNPAVYQQKQQPLGEFINGMNDQTNKNETTTNTESIKISFDRDNEQDVNMIVEVIKMILEVINNVLMVRLKHNPDLIYTLLYKRTVLTNLMSSQPNCHNLIMNIESILAHTYDRIEAYERPMSVEEIKDIIQEICNNWSFESQQRRDTNAEPQIRLLFHYVEDEQPEEFFIPYIWTRVYYSSKISFNSKRIVLFNPDEM